MFSVSIRSRVAPTSRIDLTPALTTRIGVVESASRSADSSKVTDASRCTPPRPPVANTWIPAAWAIIAVAATVVPPERPRAIAIGRSRMLILTLSSAAASRSISDSLSPTTASPSTTPMVAG